MNYPTDPLTDYDWNEHWQRLVVARDDQLGGPRPADFWDRRARAYGFSVSKLRDPLLEILDPWLDQRSTVIDVGAGTGRHAVPIAEKVEWVTAVEPSDGMRSLIPPIDNMTVVASSWLDAEVAPADVVLTAHVLYSVREPVPFIEKLEACARQRLFISLRDAQLSHPAEQLWELFSESRRARQVQFYDLYNLLHWMGRQPDVAMFRHPVRMRFESLDQALDDCRTRVGEPWDEERGRRWLEEHLEREPDGSLVHRGNEMRNGVAHWKPEPTT